MTKKQEPREWTEDTTVEKWFSEISAKRTKKNYREQFPTFLEFVQENTKYKTPSEIIESRLKHLTSTNPIERNFWENILIRFKNSIEGKELKINTVKSYLKTAMSFFAHNNVALQFARKQLEVQPSQKDMVYREWIPSREEIKLLYRFCETARDRGIQLCRTRTHEALS